ncbi:MAG: AmmeMemoRadiSam system protein A [Ferroplasma sp.]
MFMGNDQFLKSLTEDDGKILIAVAKNTISSKFNGMQLDANIPDKLQTKAGAFVTINQNRELRGCIGYLNPVMPLVKAVQKAAYNAAFSDPRFNPLSMEELNKIDIEITVLGALERINADDIKKIIIGLHGLYIKKGFNSGTLLPQVAVENSMTQQEFLSETCIKAGMDENCYKSAEIYKYEGRIFH